MLLKLAFSLSSFRDDRRTRGLHRVGVLALDQANARDSGLPADVLLGKLAKDISFALRRGTIAQVTTHHHALEDR
jgi:hypothetical protein